MDFNYTTHHDDPSIAAAFDELNTVDAETAFAIKLCKQYNEFYKSAPNCCAPCRDLLTMNDEVLSSVVHVYATRMGYHQFTPRATLLKTIKAKASKY